MSHFGAPHERDRWHETDAAPIRKWRTFSSCTPTHFLKEAAMPADVIDYKLIGDDLQGVVITLDPGEGVIAEAGAML
ncbi:MAG: hypothetical protein P3B98_12065, partial [Gemmatimonadota bacterium]|nr:hypothetical protein [Gemmatimonadota bacterium]